MSRRKQIPELRLKQMQAQNTIYDCSVNLRIEIPRDMDINTDSIWKTTLIAIANDLASRHPECDLLEMIHLILKTTVTATKRDFKVVKKNKKRLALEKNVEDAGYFCRPMPESKVIYETLKYSGPVGDDWGGEGHITINCTIKLFLSPGVHAAKAFYEDHGFPQMDCIHKGMDDIKDMLENWCGELDDDELSAFNFPDMWGWISQGFEEQLEYREMKLRRFQRSPTPSNGEESDSDDGTWTGSWAYL